MQFWTVLAGPWYAAAFLADQAPALRPKPDIHPRTQLKLHWALGQFRSRALWPLPLVQPHAALSQIQRSSKRWRTTRLQFWSSKLTGGK